ncbi:CocE/NonD family hydrolase [Streptomyces sp. NPDC087856]|uniref:CocE/NonD family hydrolase n=1 Tax=Streptomyces sp. NPDC087856 TaxID=3365811 RepID=UPI00380BE500
MDRVLTRGWSVPTPRGDLRVERGIAVTMRDGVALLTDHYLPTGTQGRGTILVRTPYGRGLPIAADARLFAGQGYHVVVQSLRGTFGSGGELLPLVTDTDDARDTIAWLREQPWFDGRLATYGASYVGATQWTMLIDPPPELRASVIVAGPHDASGFILGTGALLFNDMFTWSRVVLNQERRAGLLRAFWIFSRSAKLNAPVVSALPFGDAADKALAHRAPWLREWLSHPDRDDTFWQPRNASVGLEKTTVPTRLICGWQDLVLSQTLRQYEVLRKRGIDVTLTIGPWIHQHTVSSAGASLVEGNLDWLAEHLAGEPVQRKHQPVRIQVTGVDEWREFPEWPPPSTALVHYLQPGGRLGRQRALTSTSSFRYDPADPTPSVGGPLIDMDAGVHDNRALETRPDVLTFTTPPLTEALEIIGVPVVELSHTANNAHADVFVRLCDVDAKGTSRNFSEAFMRLAPGVHDGMLQLELDACAHRLAPGHRLRLLVAGGAHPRYMRNEGTGAMPGTGTVLLPCRHTIRLGEISRVVLPVVQ